MSQPHSFLTPTRGGDVVSVIRRGLDMRPPARRQGDHQEAPTEAVPLQGAQILAHCAFPCSPWRISVPLTSSSIGGGVGQAVQSRVPQPHQGCTSSGSELSGALALLTQALSRLPGFHNSFWRHRHLCGYVLLARSAISSKQRVWIIVYSQDRLFFLYLHNQG